MQFIASESHSKTAHRETHTGCASVHIRPKIPLLLEDRLLLLAKLLVNLRAPRRLVALQLSLSHNTLRQSHALHSGMAKSTYRQRGINLVRRLVLRLRLVLLLLPLRFALELVGDGALVLCRSQIALVVVQWKFVGGVEWGVDVLASLALWALSWPSWKRWICSSSSLETLRCLG